MEQWTNTIGCIEKADVILVTGSNTTENHPVLSSFMKRNVKFKGGKLLLIDPRRIKLAEHAHMWLRQNLGTDVAWINGMIHVIIKEDLYDKKFVEERTENFDALKKLVEKYTPEYVEEITGIPAAELAEAARIYAKAERGCICYCMGITQHTTGTDNVKSLANLGHGLREHGHRGRRRKPRSADRTTCRAHATWAVFPMCSPHTSPSRTKPPGSFWKRPGASRASPTSPAWWSPT